MKDVKKFLKAAELAEKLEEDGKAKKLVTEMRKKIMGVKGITSDKLLSAINSEYAKRGLKWLAIFENIEKDCLTKKDLKLILKSYKKIKKDSDNFSKNYFNKFSDEISCNNLSDAHKRFLKDDYVPYMKDAFKREYFTELKHYGISEKESLEVF